MVDNQYMAKWETTPTQEEINQAVEEEKVSEARLDDIRRQNVDIRPSDDRNKMNFFHRMESVARDIQAPDGGNAQDQERRRTGKCYRCGGGRLVTKILANLALGSGVLYDRLFHQSTSL